MRSLAFSSLLLLVACASSESRENSETTAALTDEAPASFELVQRGAFFDRDVGDPHYVPRSFHIGFANDRNGPWEGVRDVDISYSNEENEPVVVDVPAEHRAKKLMLYSIRYDDYAAHSHSPRTQWVSNLALNLPSPGGKFVTAHVSSGAGYPFSGECYGVSVQNERFPGKLRGIVYGFTKKSKSDYDANNDVPWQNVVGEAKHEGFLDTDFQHDGGYKGSYQSRPIWVRVPDGTSLVFKASLDRFDGNCMTDSDTKPIPPPAGQDSHLTKTYFQEAR